MEKLNDKFSNTEKIKRESRAKQSVVNYVFIVMGVIYFLLLSTFLILYLQKKKKRIKSLEKQYKDNGSVNQHLAEKIRQLKQSNAIYENDTLKKNYTFKRPFQVLFRNMQNHAIQLSLFLFFIGFCVLLYVKYTITDERDALLNPKQKASRKGGQVKSWIETILDSFNSEKLNQAKAKL